MATNNAESAWEDAEAGCFKFLCSELGTTADKYAFVDDEIPDDLVGVWVFIIAGGPEQRQNYQMGTPARQWLADAALLGQYKTKKQARTMGGKIMNILPAYKNSRNTRSRGIKPNVNCFEMTAFPRVFSRRTANDVKVWMLAVLFRVEFGNEKA